jgi:hypothetical protein
VKNTKNPPGQITAPEYKPTHGGRPEFTADNGHTLGDYLHGKYPQAMKKKLTFDEWSNNIDIEDIDFVYAGRVWDLMEQAWKAGQENK